MEQSRYLRQCPPAAPGRVLFADDAFITTKQESLLSALTFAKKIHGPPMYFTQDWIASAQSVRKLANLNPDVAATGHGVAMYGEELHQNLRYLADHFEDIAVPSDGRYVREPARADENGTYYIPPPVFDATPFVAGGIALGVTAALIARSRRNKYS